MKISTNVPTIHPQNLSAAQNNKYIKNQTPVYKDELSFGINTHPIKNWLRYKLIGSEAKENSLFLIEELLKKISDNIVLGFVQDKPNHLLLYELGNFPRQNLPVEAGIDRIISQIFSLSETIVVQKNLDQNKKPYLNVIMPKSLFERFDSIDLKEIKYIILEFDKNGLKTIYKSRDDGLGAEISPSFKDVKKMILKFNQIFGQYTHGMNL